MTEQPPEDRLVPGTPEFRKALASGKIKIVLASQSQIEKYGPEVEEVLEGLGHPEALVTDESRVGDFLEFFHGDENKAEDDALLEECRVRWGLETVEYEDYVWQVAERIRNKREGR